MAGVTHARRCLITESAHMPSRFDKLLVLDLDETLLFASEEGGDRPPDFTGEGFSFYKRPHVQTFLTTCTDWFTVGVWTSATEEYARLVVEHLFADQVKPLFVWSREKCTRGYDLELQKDHWLKDIRKLKCFGFPKERIIIVEDTPINLSRSHGNGIIVREYRGEPEDDELKFLLRYLEHLGSVENVRAVDKRAWRRRIANQRSAT